MVGSSLSELEKRYQRQQETQYRGCKTCGDHSYTEIINTYVHIYRFTVDVTWILRFVHIEVRLEMESPFY